MQAQDTDPGLDGRSATTRAAVLAGVLLSLVGLLNAMFGLASLTTDVVRLAPATAGALLVLGLVTAALGILIGRGSRAALTVALFTFGVLLVLQATDTLAGGREDSTGVPRLVVLALLVASLALARFTRGRTS